MKSVTIYLFIPGCFVAAMLIAAASCKSKFQKDAENYMNKINKTVKENSPAETND